MLVHLMFQRSLRLSSILFILYSLFCSVVVISTILSSRSLIRSSASVILLLIPSRVNFHYCVVHHYLFCSSRSLINISFIFSILFPRFWIIFIIITLNYFSGRLPISSSFISSCGFLPCSFICSIFLCLLILFNFVWGLLSVGCRFVIPAALFGVSPQWARLVQWFV